MANQRDIKTAVITGGGSGLGRAMCLELAAPGARILVADVRLDAAEDTAHMVRDRGGEAAALGTDVADPGQVEKLSLEAARWLGKTDLLVNNAGVVAAGEVGDVPLSDWAWLLDINLRGVVYGCHFFLPAMKRRREGAILNVASLAGLISTPGMAPYNVAKAAVVSLSETLAAELRPYGLGVTVLCPSFVRTSLLSNLRTANPTTRAAAENAFDRSRSSPEDVARAALAAVCNGELYCLPMAEARILWWLKRVAPRFTTRLLGSERLRAALGFKTPDGAASLSS
jgi:NAD(P)-dependent dehydrogenase (short-subunit alcohol dehydrogenase family)